MDKRRALAPGTLLKLPGMECHIESEIGRGSNAIVYRAWYPDLCHADARHDILLKELFPLPMAGALVNDRLLEAEGLSPQALADDLAALAAEREALLGELMGEGRP